MRRSRAIDHFGAWYSSTFGTSYEHLRGSSGEHQPATNWWSSTPSAVYQQEELLYYMYQSSTTKPHLIRAPSATSTSNIYPAPGCSSSAGMCATSTQRKGSELTNSVYATYPRTHVFGMNHLQSVLIVLGIIAGMIAITTVQHTTMVGRMCTINKRFHFSVRAETRAQVFANFKCKLPHEETQSGRCALASKGSQRGDRRRRHLTGRSTGPT